MILSGPSGAGKTTLHQKLLQSPRLNGVLVKSVSATTRPRRPGEKSGREYLFMKAEDFAAKRKSGYFLESQKVFQYYYGTPKKKVEELLTKGRNVLLCIDVKGARLVAREFPDALKIFIKPPSVAELKKRLQRRATEGHEDLRLRLATARREMKESVRYDHVIINDNLDDAYGDLESVVCSALPAFGGGLPGAKKKF